MGTGNSRLMSYDDALEALNQSERTLIQKTWQQLVDETGAQNAAGSTTVEEIQVHRGYFNRSLLGGRFPQALEVRRRPSLPPLRAVCSRTSDSGGTLCLGQERIFLAFRSKNREVVTFRASLPSCSRPAAA